VYPSKLRNSCFTSQDDVYDPHLLISIYVLRAMMPAIMGNLGVGFNMSIIEWALNWVDEDLGIGTLSAEMHAMVPPKTIKYATAF